MAVVTYDGMDGLENFSETAKSVLKGGAIGALTGLGVVFVTNKLPFVSTLSPIFKGVVQLGLVAGVTALAKDKVGDDVATAMGVGGASVVIGSLVGQLLTHHTAATKQGFYGYGDAVAPVVEELDGYADAVSPEVEVLDGYGYAEMPEDEGIYVEVE